ncbi:MAG: hypothetical protein ABR524_07270 [Thermoanaerobaculia bacterium]
MKRTWQLTGVAMLFGMLTACGLGDRGTPPHTEPALAALMGELQRHTMKLGYAIEGENPELAEFYLHEIEEVLESLEGIEEYDGMLVADNARTIMRPLLPPLRAGIAGNDTSAISRSYQSMLDGCNRCHTATDHEFIVITRPAGPPPFNQDFAGSRNDGGSPSN